VLFGLPNTHEPEVFELVAELVEQVGAPSVDME
jgi:hypothetical protein